MTPFLQQAARHFFAQGGVDKLCFVFPNSRSMAFFKKYLAEEVKLSGKPMLAPEMCSINDFYYRIHGVPKTDRVQLLLDLYECYAPLRNGAAEPLDEFIFWGDMILSDFADIDKYLVDPRAIYTNISDYKAIQDYGEYLSETQLAAIRRFVDENFIKRREGKIKKEFRQIWDILYPLYVSFNEKLTRENKCYEGKVYRECAQLFEKESAVDILSRSFKAESFVFVGLNALSECEKLVLRKMRNAQIARFCWDYSSAWIQDRANRSSYLLSENILEFPQAFKLDTDGLEIPEIHVMSVPSTVGQAKQLPKILSSLGASGIDTAVVLPDESLLMPVLNSIPAEFNAVNVTMGFPMGNSQIWSLVEDIASMQMRLREKDGKCWFYHRFVSSIMANPVVRAALNEEEQAICDRVKSEGKYYIPMQDFGSEGLLARIFRPVGTVREIEEYLLELVRTVASRIKTNPDMMLELDFAKDCYIAVDALRQKELPIQGKTFFKLLSSLLRNQSVPFHGEPLQGLQIMGPLETRALDFENLVVMSCNEGMFPRRSAGESFIPAELRRGFGLPTYEYQDAMWAYYFYRMLQRAGKVWLLYDSRTEMSRSGEESRYIKQLELHFGAKLIRHTFSAPLEDGVPENEIAKTPEHVEIIKSKYLSASSLQSYLACPAKFFYHVVEGLREPDEVKESLDAGGIGTALHQTMEALYKECNHLVTKEHLESLIADQDALRKRVAEQICSILKTIEVSGRNIIYEDIVLRYVTKILERDLEKLRELGTDSFRVDELEAKRYLDIDGFKFIGIIDRLDSFQDGVLRVVDYKTGKVTDKDILIDSSNAQAVAELLFGPSNDKRPKIALQLYLYDLMARKKDAAGRKVVNCIYQTGSLFTEKPMEVELCQEFLDAVRPKLSSLLSEIADTEVGFARTTEGKTCEYCGFKSICGR